MRATVQVIDESPTGEQREVVFLRLASNRLTARELISSRVKSEVENHNNKPAEIFKGLIQPSEAERVLNGFRMKRRRTLDAKAQVKIAIEGFNRNDYLLLVDDKQVESLDDEMCLTSDSVVSFVKLLPLVGG